MKTLHYYQNKKIKNEDPSLIKRHGERKKACDCKGLRWAMGIHQCEKSPLLLADGFTLPKQSGKKKKQPLFFPSITFHI